MLYQWEFSAGLVMVLLLFLIFPKLGKLCLYIIFFPITIWRWRKNCLLAQRRRNNYELLGHYMFIFSNNPEIIKHLRKIIEDGISEREFQSLLESNLHNLNEFETEQEKNKIRARLEEESEFKKMAMEQQEILIQSRLSMEQIKFREKLLDSLYQKIQEKYQL